MDYEDALMAKAAWYYYFEGLTQQQISDRIGVSRIRVIRLLEKARQTGIIQFSLRKGNEERLKTERMLMERYGLDDVFLVPGPTDPSKVNANIAEAASMYMMERLDEGGVINIGYGDTPSRVLNNLATMTEQTITCVSLTGGVSYYLPNTRSSVFNAQLRLIPAPLLASSKEMADAIRQETSVSEISRMISLAQMTVVGIGSMDGSATIFQSGILNSNDLLYLSMRGAKGDVLSHFLDGDGRLIESPIEERLVSTSLEKLSQLRNVIGVAAGSVKTDAIRAVLRGHILDILITDMETAEAILTRDREE